jgi:hypothetical protein
MLAEQTFPFWWDDADNFAVLEKLSVAAFNKVCIILGEDVYSYIHVHIS